MTDLVTQQSQGQVPAWRSRLDANLPAVMEALPAHIGKDKFKRIAANAVASTPALKRCMEKNPGAVLGALLRCAQDGLLPNGREAALVPYKDDLTYIPMIAGVLKQMRNSGEVKSVRARIVHENDEFKIIYGDDERFEHDPALSNRGSAIGAYAIIELADGEVYREWMDRDDIMKVKGAAKAKGGPWSGPFELEMWRKTVLKRAAKYCPMSADLQELMDRDNALYDLEAVEVRREPTAKAKFASLQSAPERLTFDEVPAKDISDDEAEVEPEKPTAKRARKDIDAFVATTNAEMEKDGTSEGATKIFEAAVSGDFKDSLTDEDINKMTEKLLSI